MLKRWIEFPTAKNRFLLDMEFLLSSYECKWGNGCKGINTSRPDLGCCANGAYLTDEDYELLNRRVPLLTSDEWQHMTPDFIEVVKERKFGLNRKSGERKTAIQNPSDWLSGCVFANDADYEGGAGCALHIAAMNRGENFIDWKPEICWQMPLIASFVDEMETWLIHMFHWELGVDHEWFCEHDEFMWVAERPLYQTMSAELKRTLDDIDVDAYPIAKEICDQAFRQSAQWRGEKPLVKPVPVTLQGTR